MLNILKHKFARMNTNGANDNKNPANSQNRKLYFLGL